MSPSDGGHGGSGPLRRRRRGRGGRRGSHVPGHVEESRVTVTVMAVTVNMISSSESDALACQSRRSLAAQSRPGDQAQPGRR